MIIPYLLIIGSCANLSTELEVRPQFSHERATIGINHKSILASLQIKITMDTCSKYLESV